jgi:hypothetical protein
MADQESYVYFEDELALSCVAFVELMQEVLSKGKVFRFRASGFSMSPFTQDDDLISVSTLNNSFPLVGEVVAFTDSERGKLLVHRIVSKDHANYLIAGDNQLDPRYDKVPLENILGRVIGVERNGKQVELGLGLEKSLIALFSRARLLQPQMLRLASLIHPFRRVRL